MTTGRPPTWHNVWIFSAGVLALSAAAGGIMAAGHEIGGLLFILSPILVTVALRSLRDGWGDAGLRLRGSLRWYALAVLGFPMIFAVTLALGAAGGEVRFSAGFPLVAPALFAVQFLPRMLFAVSEEFGWRGYLEPRLAALGVPPARRHLLVAAVWGVWHLPYILATEHYTQLPLAVHLPLFSVAIIAMAYWFGAMRQRTNSVWPAVLAHGVANTLAFPLLDPSLVVIGNPLVFAARPEALVPLALIVAVAAASWFAVHPRAGHNTAREA